MSVKKYFIRKLAALLRDAGYEIRRLPQRPAPEAQTKTTAALRAFVERKGVSC